MQQVNLLTEDVRPKVEPLVATHVGYLWGAFTILLVGISVWQSHDLARLERESQVAMDKVSALSQSPEQPAVQLDQFKNRVERLAQQRDAQAQLLNRFNLRDDARVSRLLIGLSHASRGDLWLQEIHVRVEQRLAVSLKGEAVEAAAIPQYLQRLAEEEAFAGMEFAELDVQALDRGVAFSIEAPAELILANRGASPGSSPGDRL